jgi:hypothetical protein
VQYIIDGKQSDDGVEGRPHPGERTPSPRLLPILEGGRPLRQTATYDNGEVEVPAKPSEVVTVDQS